MVLVIEPRGETRDLFLEAVERRKVRVEGDARDSRRVLVASRRVAQLEIESPDVSVTPRSQSSSPSSIQRNSTPHFD